MAHRKQLLRARYQSENSAKIIELAQKAGYVAEMDGEDILLKVEAKFVDIALHGYPSVQAGDPRKPNPNLPPNPTEEELHPIVEVISRFSFWPDGDLDDPEEPS